MTNKIIKWTRASWRPILAFVMIVAIIQYVIIGWFIAYFTGNIVQMEIPPEAWQLMTVYIGAYGVGRSIEHFGKNWQSNSEKDDQELS